MRPIAFWAAVLAAPVVWFTTGGSEAQSFPGGFSLTARSRSEQFLIYGGNDTVAVNLQRSNTVVVLAPSLAAVSCERIKSALLSRLGAPDRWQGRISLAIIPASRLPAFDLTVVPYSDGWQYRLQAPDRVPPRQFVQAIVRTLLLEMANRSARDRSSEVPFWLAEGLTEELIAGSGVDLVVDTPITGRTLLPATMTQRDIRGGQTLVQAHECLQTNLPLTIEQLSWPEGGVDSPVFRASSQLLVNRLLALPGGPAAMQRFIAGLSRNFNWQTTFLKAYGEPFDSLRALEKWWLLETARFTSRSRLHVRAGIDSTVLTERWTAVESWRRLEEILRAPVRVHADSNALPARGATTIQTALAEWDAASLSTLMTAKVRELEALRFRLNFSVVRMADEYRLVLSSHLNELDRSRTEIRRRTEPPFSVRSLNRDTSRKLDVLDNRRRQEAALQEAAAGLKPAETPVAVRPGPVP